MPLLGYTVERWNSRTGRVKLKIFPLNIEEEDLEWIVEHEEFWSAIVRVVRAATEKCVKKHGSHIAVMVADVLELEKAKHKVSGDVVEVAGYHSLCLGEEKSCIDDEAENVVADVETGVLLKCVAEELASIAEKIG